MSSALVAALDGMIPRRGGVEWAACPVGPSRWRECSETARWRIEGARQLHLQTSGPTALRRARVICEEDLAIMEPVGRSR